MSELHARDPVLLRHYEALVFTTAQLLVVDLNGRGVATAEDDLDDVMQLLRWKVYKALGYYDPAKVKPKEGETADDARDRYVFMCLRDTVKDIAKRKRKPLSMIEDVAPVRLGLGNDARDQFEGRYLSQSHDDTFESVEELKPLVPNTLSDLERRVLVLLYREYTHREIAARLGISKGEVSSAVRQLRCKLADWRPAGGAPAAAPAVA